VHAALVHELDLLHQAIEIQLPAGGEGRLGDGKDAAQGLFAGSLGKQESTWQRETKGPRANQS
jgi:hypothetical protein